jgi:Asp-tRNA(Asn)/Glu-tRNA(Gln) amidotransferase A subunit family amidase
LARSVDDAALLAHVLCGRAGAALPSAQGVVPRIGVTLTSRASSLSGDMLAMIDRSARRLSAAGARVHEVAPWPAAFDALFEAQRTVQVFETARALAAEFQYRRAQLSPLLANLLEEGYRIEPAAYANALACGRSARGAIETLFAEADVLITAAAPGAAPNDLSTTGEPAFSRPWQLLDCPCLSLPGGVDNAGLPLGLQVVARPNDDGRLFAAAAWVSRSLHSDALTQGLCLA